MGRRNIVRLEPELDFALGLVVLGGGVNEVVHTFADYVVHRSP